jgi:CubicO group peptidase (beta-lactamase class C family)
MSAITVDGMVTPEFEPLADVLARLLAAHAGTGAALSVYQHGREVVRLGVDAHSTETRVVVFSVSKLLLSLGLHRAAERGDVDLTADVGELWPEFGDAGGRGIRIVDVLSHRTSLAALDVELSGDAVLAGGDRIAVLDAARGARATVDHGYHAVTYGTILGAIVEARFGTSVGEWLNRELGPVAGDIELGTAIAPFSPLRFEQFVETTALARTDGMRDGLLEALTADPLTFNSMDFLRAGLPSMGVVASAGALARVMASVLGEVDGFRLIGPRSREQLTLPRAQGTDRVLGVETAFGAGVQLPFARLPMTGHEAFGHEGAGGCVAFADPSTGIAVGFTTDVFPAAPGASPILLGLLPALGLLARRAAD